MPSLSIGPLTGVAEEKHLQKLQDKVIGLFTELSAAPAPRFFKNNLVTRVQVYIAHIYFFTLEKIGIKRSYLPYNFCDLREF